MRLNLLCGGTVQRLVYLYSHKPGNDPIWQEELIPSQAFGPPDNSSGLA